MASPKTHPERLAVSVLHSANSVRTTPVPVAGGLMCSKKPHAAAGGAGTSCSALAAVFSFVTYTVTYIKPSTLLVAHVDHQQTST